MLKIAGKSLGSVAFSRDNHFDLIRLIAASLVIFSHTYPLMGLGDDLEIFKLANGHETLGALSVHIFFVISGFLITKSWLSKPIIFDYMRNRILRIFPGLFVCLLLTVFLMGPVLTISPLRDYFSAHQTYIYYLRTFFLLLGVEFKLPGVFVHNPYPDVVNGSLWTLPIEFKCYLLTLLLGKFNLLSRQWLSLALLALLFTLQILFHYEGTLYSVIYFVIGAVYYQYRDKIHLSPALALVLGLGYTASFQTPFYFYMGCLAIPYILFTLAFIPANWLKPLTSRGDYSYGLYIYAFPVQQILMQFFGPKLGLLPFFLMAFVMTYILAALSWHLVEKPSLSLKHLFTKPGLGYSASPKA